MIRTVELFAGVGGFRYALEKNNLKTKKKFKIVWSNQWEPSTKVQHASNIYQYHYGSLNHSCENISKVDFSLIPKHDLLVGGFPCQDYSVARAPYKGNGIRGKKGVLWWSIYELLKSKGSESPNYLMLENVDRLLKSPTYQRGRDFAIMLASLSDLGYAVEWRVINAADYGMPQRRKRVFIMAYKEGTPAFSLITKPNNAENWIKKSGIMQKAFKVKFNDLFCNDWLIEGDLQDISENTEIFNPKDRPFGNAGIMINRRVITSSVQAIYDKPPGKLEDVLTNDKEVPDEFFIPEHQHQEWKDAKGAKKLPRKSKDGYEYNYSEGKMAFPDQIDKPARTIVTGEGGSSVSRFKHVIKVTDKKRLKTHKYRRLTPVELEQLNGFPKDWTKYALDTNDTEEKLKVVDSKRAFLMGNALVVDIVTKLAKALYAQENKKYRP